MIICGYYVAHKSDEPNWEVNLGIACFETQRSPTQFRKQSLIFGKSVLSIEHLQRRMGVLR